jgi:DNA-binding NtrC family response regulator
VGAEVGLGVVLAVAGLARRAVDTGGASGYGCAVSHLLIVDDDNDIVEVLGEILRGDGHEVRTASTGEEGLAVLKAAPLTEVVVLDVDMPVLGGPGMAHKMLLHDAGEEHIPIILMSARPDLVEIARNMGTPYFVKKPAPIDVFRDRLSRALAERNAPTSA